MPPAHAPGGNPGRREASVTDPTSNPAVTSSPAMFAGMQSIIDFILELDKLKAVTRKTRPLGLERYENSAEHSWHLAMLALILAEHANEPLDVPKVVKMVLVHDIVEIDANTNKLTLKVSDDEIARRKSGWKQPALKAKKGILFKYARSVRPADEGCVTDEA